MASSAFLRLSTQCQRETYLWCIYRFVGSTLIAACAKSYNYEAKTQIRPAEERIWLERLLGGQWKPPINSQPRIFLQGHDLLAGTASHAWEGTQLPPAGMFDFVPPFHTLLILVRIPTADICIMKVKRELGADRGNCLHWGVWAWGLAGSMSSLCLSSPTSHSSWIAHFTPVWISGKGAIGGLLNRCRWWQTQSCSKLLWEWAAIIHLK